jgi:hypothetical protein
VKTDETQKDRAKVKNICRGKKIRKRH